MDASVQLCGSSTNGHNGCSTTRPNRTFRWTPAAACTGTPNAGSAISTSTNIVCPGTPFTLSLQGATVATGLSYQWQSSPDNTAWTNITAATSSSYTTTQTATSLYYRAIVTCAGNSSNSASVMVTATAGPVYATLP